MGTPRCLAVGGDDGHEGRSLRDSSFHSHFIKRNFRISETTKAVGSTGERNNRPGGSLTDFFINDTSEAGRNCHSGHSAFPAASSLPPHCGGEVQTNSAGHEDPGDPLHLPLLSLDDI